MKNYTIQELEKEVLDLTGDLYLDQIGLKKLNFSDTSNDYEENVENIKELSSKSEDAIKEYDLKKYLCPAILSVSNDISEVAKIVVGVLYPLSLAGKLLLPISPLILSGISLVIFNAGIHSICKSDSNEN